MTFFYAFLLGIIQGLTEFIPVSSTAHLLIGQKLLGIPSDTKTFSFMVIVQLGTVFALILFFWRDIWMIIKAFLIGIRDKRPFDDFQSRLGWLVIIATIPALILGYFLKDLIELMFRSPGLLAGIRLLISAVLLFFVELFGRRQRELDTAVWQDALTVGLFQVLALFPGASRSGTTIAGGMVRGFTRTSAARFAFLMSVPILLAAGAYESLQVIAMTGTRAFLPYLIVGFITSAIVGWMSVKWLLEYLSKHSLYVFAIYCALAGISALAFLR
ncbi:MAG: undecaprenyl-diphosphatase UppP [Anaerolineales bacterium]